MTKKRKRGLFPRKTLLASLRIAQAIQDNNAGQPYARLDLVKVLGSTPSSTAFRSLITASGQFGLTKGSYSAKNIELTGLGKSIVAPRNTAEKNKALLESLLSIDLFKKFFERYDASKLPKEEFIQNTLERDFGVPKDDVSTCYDIIYKNAEELGLLDDFRGSTYIRLGNLSTEKLKEKSTEEIIIADEEEIESEIPEEKEFEEEKPKLQTESIRSNKIFVVHGRNRKPLEQLKNILDEFKIPYNVAIDEPHRGPSHIKKSC